jgi:DNA-binding MarR family transcriptional regulator
MPKLELEIMQPSFRNERQKAVINVIYTGNWLMGRNAQFLKNFNLTHQQFNVLRILRGQRPKPCSILLLKERMLDKMSDVSRLVERLRKAGLVRREVCLNDRRSVEVVITDQGLELLNEIDKHIENMDAITNTLNERDLKTLNRLLDKMRS